MTTATYAISRSSPATRVAALAGLLVLAALVAAPWWAGRADMRLLSEIFLYLSLACLWNLLAGYAGLVSVGQQAFVGFGGYMLFALAIFAGLSPLNLPETDLLLASDYAAHEAGFAAAQRVTGGHAALYHVDNTDPARPSARTLREEIARVVQARAANPDWVAGMRRHGFRGAAEIAATLEHMAAFAHLAAAVGPHLFDAYHGATLGDPETHAFLARENPGALQAMNERFSELHAAGLWTTLRNSIAVQLGAAE